MKLLVSWTMVATLLLLGARADAQDTAAAHTASKKAVSVPVMSLVPGIYVAGGGDEDPNAFAVRIREVKGDEFKGTIELARLDKSGELVRETTGLMGVLGKQREVDLPFMYSNTGIAPLTMKLENGPLQSRMLGLNGNMSSTGFRLYWTLPRNASGATHGTFVLSTEDAYQQIMARYGEVSSFKKRLRADETSSANLMAAQLNDYIKSADQWLGTPPGHDLETIENKVRALYAEQRKVDSGDSPDKEAAAVIEIQIDAYGSQAEYISRAQEKQENAQRGAWFMLDQVLQDSACIDGSSARLGHDVSPSCNELPALYAAAEKRWNKMHQEQVKRFQVRQRVLEALRCFSEAAEIPMEPNRGVPASCGKYTSPQK